MPARCRRPRRRRPNTVAAPRVLDAATAPALVTLAVAAARGHRRVVVDLRHVEAVDAAGLRALRILAARLPVVLRGPAPAALVRLGALLCLRDTTTHPNV
jgi:hypothetical protein